MKTLVRASILCGCFVAAVSYGAISEPQMIFVDPDASLIWKTLTSERAEVPLFWPESAVSAKLTVSSGTAVRSVFDLTPPTSLVRVIDGLPSDALAEAVCDLVLEFFDANSQRLSTEVARLGFVRGTNGASFAFIPEGDATWGNVGRTAVLPIPDGTESVTVNGAEVAGYQSPGWMGVRFRSGTTRVEARGVDWLASADLIRDPVGLMLFVR